MPNLVQYQNYDYILPFLYLKETSNNKGVGVFTSKPIPNNTIIGIEVGGEILSAKEIEKKYGNWSEHSQQIHSDLYWGLPPKNEVPFLSRLNHSCNPNLGRFGDMMLIALRDIEPQEELCWDYAMSESDPSWSLLCYCQTDACRKKITGNDWMIPSIQLRYHGYFVPYLQQQIEKLWNKGHIRILDKKIYFVDQCSKHDIVFHEIERIVADQHSPYQHIQIFQTKKLGKALVLDGYPQISEEDAAEYTEALVYPSLLAHRNPKNILILGGGDGVALSTILRDQRAQTVTLVDIDKTVIELTKKEMPALWNDAQNDRRVKIIIEDALLFLKQTRQKFDVIISDLTDPDEGTASKHLLNDTFFKMIKRCLGPNGVFTIQAGELSPQNCIGHITTKRMIRKHFPYALSYGVYIPWFSEIWSFIIASPETLPEFSKQEKNKILFVMRRRLVPFFKILTPEILTALFSIKNKETINF